MEPLGDLSEQYFFFYLSIHNNDIVGYLKQVTFYYTTFQVWSQVKRFFFLREKEMVQTPYYVIINFFIWGHIQS